MTTKYIDATGKTEDDAIASALAQIGMERDDVSVEVLERARKGFLGIGASPAKVRVTYEVVEEPIPELVVKKPVQAAPEPEKGPERTKPPVSAAPVQEQQRTERVEKQRNDSPRHERRDRPQRPAEKPQESPAPAVKPADLGEPCNDEKAQQITAFLVGLLEHMGSSAQVKVYLNPEGRYKVILEGEKLGSLIGRRGETLDAIQQLTNYSVNKGGEKRVRIHVDAENYRLKREQSLQHLARKVASKVVKYRRSITLEPMNAYERHVIHTALQDVDGVTTYSMGTDPNRRVIVAYNRGNNR